MSENNNINEFDLMMKSILEEGQEEVPAHVWDGISEELDKAARRRTVVLWWRRAAAGTAAAAAIVAGVFLHKGNDDQFVPQAEGSDMIAVAEPSVEPEAETAAFEDYMAEAETAVSSVREMKVQMHESMPSTASEAIGATYAEAETEDDAVSSEYMTQEKIEKEEKTKVKEYFPEDWGHEENVRQKRGVSFVISGVTGTNNSEHQNRINPMKRPAVDQAPDKTGIEETSTRGSYGIPVSFGAGVKVDLNEKWSVGTGINYTLLSRQFHGKYTHVNADGRIDNSISSDIRNVQQYVGIPVNIFYDIMSNERISVYAYAGGAVEKCLSDKYSVLGTSVVHKEKVDGIQLSADAGIGVEFMLGKHIGMYIDPSLRYYFDNGQPKSIRTTQPLMMGFEMGFRARL